MADLPKALQMAGWFPEEEEDREATGVSIGSGMTSPREFFHVSELLVSKTFPSFSKKKAHIAQMHIIFILLYLQPVAITGRERERERERERDGSSA